MTKLLTMALAISFLCFSSLAIATPGGLNKDGCHNSKKAGYHCHPSKKG